jgi:hypothetical protein
MHRGDKSLIGNRGYRRFLKLKSGRRFEIDPPRIALDALFDGIYVLQRCILRPEQHLSRAAELLELLEQEPNDTADALVGVDLDLPDFVPAIARRNCSSPRNAFESRAASPRWRRRLNSYSVCRRLEGDDVRDRDEDERCQRPSSSC